MHRFSLLLIITAIACASQSGSPLVSIKQLSAVAPLRIAVEGGLPVEYEIEITNPFDHSVTLTSIEVETIGDSGAYAMKRVRHAFSQDIAPHAVATVGFRAWVQTLLESETGVVGSPVSVRGIARFDSTAGKTQTAFAARVQ
ncbi:MAG: hypothetical protein M3041_05300 [Acidobacteriota bacterium]|nr:hypothetical protein [Acidobacteriota bacterium]